MRCSQCDYPLWNLRSRQCPECGLAFLPSEFEFVLNSVRFCCPHCNQDYYGTGEKGHLVPPAFSCVTCGNPVTMDEMVLLPTEGVAEEQTVTDTMPWIDRRSSRLGGYFSTVFRGLFEPPRLARAMPVEAAPFRALAFAILCGVVGPLVGGVFLVVMPMAMFAMIPMGGGGGRGGGVAMVLAMVATVLGMVAAVVVVFLVLLALWILSAHAILRMTGPVRGSIAYTVEPLCYGSAGSLITAIPCVGFYLVWAGLIWWSVSAILMLRVRQAVSGMRASIAVLALPMVLLMLLAAYIMLVFVPMIQGAATAVQQAQQQQAAAQQAAIVAGEDADAAPPTWQGMYGGVPGRIDVAASVTQASDVARGITAYRDREGEWPAHVLQVIHSNDMFAQNVILPGSVRTVDRIVIGPMTLGHFALLPTERQRSFVRAVAASAAEAQVHRLGDYVFTCHGLPQEADRRLWLAVSHPSEADLKAFPTTDSIMVVVDVGGSVRPVRASVFGDMLEEQNEHRASLGLPPLPDPRGVGDELGGDPDR